MKPTQLLVGLAFLGLLAAGCGSGQTPEEAEAAKYPKAKPLTAEEQKRAEGLTQSVPPSGGSQ